MCATGRQSCFVGGYQFSGAYHPGSDDRCHAGSDCHDHSNGGCDSGTYYYAGSYVDRNTDSDSHCHTGVYRNTGPDSYRHTRTNCYTGPDSYRHTGTDCYTKADRHSGSDQKADYYAVHLRSKRHYNKPTEIFRVFLCNCGCRNRRNSSFL